MKHHIQLTSAVAGLTLLCAAPAWSGGLAISSQGAIGMGNAYAGAGASANDVATVWANPAAMIYLKNGKQVVGLAGNITATTLEFTDKGSTVNPAFGSGPVSGTTSETNDNNSYIPNIYFARHVNPDLAFGFGLSAPFGTSSDYGDTWTGRYHALETNVSAIDLNPTVAYRVNEKLSIGGGISVQIVNAKLESALDSAALCYGLAPTIDCINAGISSTNTVTQDGSATIEADGTGVTFNLGLLYTPMPGTNIGFTYRHGTDHKLSGDADFTLNEQLAQVFADNQIPLFTDTGTTVTASLPATYDFSIAHALNPKVQLLGSVLWTQWNVFDQLVSDFDNPAQPNSTVTFNYEDSVRASAGFNYFLNEKVTLRAGFAYDQEPVPNPSRRSPRGAANDRYWYSAGASYAFNKKASLHFGFAHLEVDQSAIDNTGDAPGSPTLRGLFDLTANLASLQFNWQF